MRIEPGLLCWISHVPMGHFYYDFDGGVLGDSSEISFSICRIIRWIPPEEMFSEYGNSFSGKHWLVHSREDEELVVAEHYLIPIPPDSEDSVDEEAEPADEQAVIAAE